MGQNWIPPPQEYSKPQEAKRPSGTEEGNTGKEGKRGLHVAASNPEPTGQSPWGAH